MAPRYAGHCGFAATICCMTIQSMLAIDWLTSLRRCQDMLERHSQNLAEIAHLSVYRCKYSGLLSAGGSPVLVMLRMGPDAAASGPIRSITKVRTAKR